MSRQIDDALDTIVKFTDQNANMKEELKISIHETVSNPRNLTCILKENLNQRTSENLQLQKEVNEMKKQMAAHRTLLSTGQVAPSIGNTSVPTRDGNVTSTSPSGGRKKLRRSTVREKRNAI